MVFKYLILVMLVLILISLGKALFHLSSAREDDGKKMVTALAWRIALPSWRFAAASSMLRLSGLPC